MKNKYIRITAFVICLGTIPSIASAQREVATQNFANTTDGSPVPIVKYENVTGSPYLIDDWSTALVKLQSGQTYKDVKVKYDQVSDELRFENNGKELVFINPISEFKIKLPKNNSVKDLYFKCGFAPDPKAFYQVLAEGKTTLIKKNRKIIVDKTPYNSATAVKVFEPQTKYYLYRDHKFEGIKNNKKTILGILSDKTAVLNSYIQKENINLNRDEDFGKLITYYNSL